MHNHPPRCCCKINLSPDLVVSITHPCPSCPDHGELATLSQPHAIAYNPADEDEECDNDEHSQ